VPGAGGIKLALGVTTVFGSFEGVSLAEVPQALTATSKISVATRARALRIRTD
jgi:hypothetical protein